MRWGARSRWLGTLALLLAPGAALAQDTADYFKQNCASCHTIGGGQLTGPDLKDVSRRKDRAWLQAFMLNPKAVIDGGDRYASDLVEKYRGVIMPPMPASAGMSREDRARAILDLIEAESKLERSQFAGVVIADRPLTPADVTKGREIFLGLTPLAKGGPSCISCHRANGAGALGGGRLGPDLTRVYERLHGRKELAAWLSAPATPTMLPVYKQHPLEPDEILALVAFFDDAARNGREESGVALVTFFLLGLLGAVIGLVVLDVIWKGRFRAVRRVLVHGEPGSNHGPGASDRVVNAAVR